MSFDFHNSYKLKPDLGIMKKRNFIVALFLVLVLFATGVLAADNSETAQCRNDCVVARDGGLNFCALEFSDCKASCSGSVCARECSRNYNLCKKNFVSDYKMCTKLCLGADLRCLNGTFERNEKFAQGCDVCKCNAQGKITCSREPFCNRNVTISSTSCAQGGGFFERICNGPYFDIVCSQKKYCICAGNAGYSCPADYDCLMDFVSPNKRSHTIDGWKTLLGVPLGEIGVCVK